MKPDHKAALKTAQWIEDKDGGYKNLAAAYLELREKAKAVYESAMMLPLKEREALREILEET